MYLSVCSRNGFGSFITMYSNLPPAKMVDLSTQKYDRTILVHVSGSAGPFNHDITRGTTQHRTYLNRRVDGSFQRRRSSTTSIMYPSPILLAWIWLLLSTTHALSMTVNRSPDDSSRPTSVQFDGDPGILFKRGPSDNNGGDSTGSKPSSSNSNPEHDRPPWKPPIRRNRKKELSWVALDAVDVGPPNLEPQFTQVRWNKVNTVLARQPKPTPDSNAPPLPMPPPNVQPSTQRISSTQAKDSNSMTNHGMQIKSRRQNPQANRMSGNTDPKRPSPASSSNSITTGNYPTWLNTGDRGIDLKRPPANPPSLIAPPPDLSNFVSMINPGNQSKARSRDFRPYPVPETQRPAVKPSSMQPGPSTGPKSGSRPTRDQRLDMLLQQATTLSTESSNSDSGKPPGSKSRKFRG